jgi:DNA-binding XRE family transcriptional regulator
MNAFCTSHARILHMSRGRVSLKTIGQCGKAEPLEIVATWTGQQVRALRTAWRLTIEEFAEKLGIATRTVAKWEADPSFAPALAMQQVLDCALEQVPAPVRLRFRVLAESGSQPLLDRRMPPPSRIAVVLDAVNGQVAVPGGGQVKVPTPRADYFLFRVVPPRARAWRMR